MDKRRSWIAVLLEEGLRLGILSPEDILTYMTPAVLATDLPPSLVATVLQAGLDNATFDPTIVVQTLGPKHLAEHMPLPLLWQCLDDAAGVIIKESPTQRAAKGAAASESDLDSDIIGPGEVRPEDVPVIEVLEE
jgi:hypothetical protein